MYIQCFIKKADGSPVFVDYEGVRYIFQKNEFGHSVCFVGNQSHERRLKMMGAACYQEYQAPDDADPSKDIGATPVVLGGRQERQKTNPLPDGLTVDEGLSQAPGDVHNPDWEAEPIRPDPDPDPENLTGLMAEVLTGEGSEPTPGNDLPIPPEDQNQEDQKEGKADSTAVQEKARADEENPLFVDWAPEAKEAKIKEFKFLTKGRFKQWVNDHAGEVQGWPDSVKSALAIKIETNFPGRDPGIEGFDLNDYLGSGNTSDS